MLLHEPSHPRSGCWEHQGALRALTVHLKLLSLLLIDSPYMRRSCSERVVTSPFKIASLFLLEVRIDCCAK